MTPIPLPLKEQNVIFIRGMDSQVSDENLITFISNVLKNNGGEGFERIEISRKIKVPLAVAFFPKGYDIETVIQNTNEKTFEGMTIMTCKYLNVQERIKSQIEREKKRPLNKLYLQGLKENVTEDKIIEQIKALFPNQTIQINVSLREQVYPQVRLSEQGPVQGKTALIEL